MRCFYNQGGLQSLALTFDLDWAPEFVLAELISVLQAYGVSATLFATQPCPSLERLSPNLERAWHPNFAPGSSQGESIDEVLIQLKEWFPGAQGSRSHCLIQSSPLLRRLCAHGLIYDSSLQLFDHPNLEVFQSFFGLIRVPYVWSDAAHLAEGRPIDLRALFLEQPGLKVLAWHPLQWYLGAQDLSSYEAAKALGPLPSLRPEQLAPLRRSGGIATLLDELLKLIQRRGLRTYTLSELVRRFQELPRPPWRATWC